VPLGALTDRFGERLTLTLGLVGLATGSLLVAGAPTYALLLAAVFVLGSLYGTAIPGTNKAVFDRIEPGRQNLAMGIKQVGVTGERYQRPPGHRSRGSALPQSRLSRRRGSRRGRRRRVLRQLLE